MVFSSTIFIFAFLPLILLLVFLGPRQGEQGVLWRNSALCIGSFIFYAWGEPLWVIPLFILAWINYELGKWIEAAKAKPSVYQVKWNVFAKNYWNAKKILIFGIICNIGLLFVVKYGVWILNNIFKISFYPTIGLTPNPIELDIIALPLGISFFTFQATSYLIDVYRGDIAAARRYIDFSCYLSMFSQLVAGPIVRYADIADEITSRKDNISMFYRGIKRFVIGLAKKILIANQVALIADWVFALPHDELTTEYAWVGILAYAMQIYFDFSAYSDMAIGIGLMFGFNYLENFKHPYAARSMQDFWRRWHISLSSWLRDYLYIPLGGSRGSNLQTYCNLFIIFFICGLWHGAALTFIIWGLWHGLFLVFERSAIGQFIPKMPTILQHLYVWIVFLVGWVFFRTEDIFQSWIYLQALGGITPAGLGSLTVFILEDTSSAVLLLIATILSFGKITDYFKAFYQSMQTKSILQKNILEINIILYGCLLCFLCGMFILSGSYNPFIYFRF